MADNFDEFDDDRDEAEAAEEDALYLAEEVNTDDEGDDDAELASASSTLDEEEDVEDADEDGNEPGFISEEERARSLMVDMPNPHGSIIEGANGGEGTIVRAAFLGKEMQTSFLEYSMSVIVSRALPDVRDGLKPVHRRILYAMNESGYTPNKPHMKSARTVGDVIGKYHPHGDSAVYDTMVRLAQPFSLRLPLIDGHGNLTIRAKCEIEEKKNGRASIVVKEIPYQVNRKRLLEKLGELVRDKKLPEISNIHDAADRKGIDIIVDLKSNAIPQVVLNKLFKHTQLQVGFGCNMLALVNGTPRVLSLKEILFYYIEHQKDVVTRRTRYELAKAEEREHILEGYIIALDNIDEVIHIIRSSETDKEAAARLTERFGLSEKQTNAILEMRLRRLTGLERTKIEEELAELREKIAYYKQILADENLLKQVIKEELQEIKKKYNTPRRTRLTGEAKDIEVEDLIAEENMVVTMTKAGYIKRLPVSTYRQQKRGGKGMQGVNLKDADFVEHLFVASTHSYMLFFSTKGKVYRLKVYEIPEAGRHARGTAIVNLLPLEKGESISAVIATKDFPAEEFLMFATAQGNVKKTSMDQYDRTRRDGLIAINLKDGDELISVKRVAKGEKVIMVSSAGKAILWDESEARAMGRGTMGVRGMNVPADAHVLGMEIAKPGTDLFVITEKGYGKRTKIEEYPEHHRGGQGVYTITMTHKKGLLSVMKIVGPDDEIMIVSEDGVIVRTPVKGISELGRSTQGVKVMNVADKDKVCAVAIASTGKKKAKKAAPADENQMGLLEEESEEDTLAIDDLDDDLGDEGEETEE